MHIDAKSNSTYKRYQGGLDLIREQSSLSIKSAPESPTKKIMNDEILNSDSNFESKPKESNQNDDLNDCISES